MAPQQLANVIAKLSPEQQRAVEEFIVYLQTASTSSPVSFRAALDAFVRQHPDLLRRLAK